MKFKDFLLTEKFASADRIKQRFGTAEDPVAYINVHKNPDYDEVLEIINDFKETDPEQYKKNGGMDFVRGFFDKNTGDLYVWYGTFFHDNVAIFLKKQPKSSRLEKDNRFRFAWLKGDKHLTVEGEDATDYFHDDTLQLKKVMLKNLFKAFPMVKGKKGPNINASSDAWVPAITKSGSDTKEPTKEPSKEITKITPKESIKELAKEGDILVLRDAGKFPVLALAFIKKWGDKKDFHYIFKANKKNPNQYPAEKILKASHLNFVWGKENITKDNEPYASQLSTGDNILKIIPNPNPKPEPKKEPNNLYTPKRKEGEQTYRAYTNRN